MLSEYDVAWPEDTISLWRTSDFRVNDGVIENNNAPTGVCLMFEGSKDGVSGGLVTDVEARGCGQCFSGYPMTDLTFSGNTCAQPLCPSEAADMGLLRYKPSSVMYTAGDNNEHHVQG